MKSITRKSFVIGLGLCLLFFTIVANSQGPASGNPPATPAPVPLLSTGHPVNWWLVFKFNSGIFPGCSASAVRACTFGGTVQPYSAYGQQFVYASSENESLQDGSGCAGDTLTDPLGATFNQIYNGAYFYVVWNDQFYDDPAISGCTTECGSPWGHSKGVVAWNTNGAGFVLQVTTPSWPASGNASHPRKTDGNTLGCVKDDDVEVSQDFFALTLTKDDLVKVLTAMQNSSIVTDPTNPQIVKNGGPSDVQALVSGLGKQSKSKQYIVATLSSGVQLISKPSHLNVPPWQMVSSLLGGVSLRAATWWTSPEIPSTTASTKVGCWDASLKTKPGAVQIATTGSWQSKTFDLTGGMGTNFNYSIFWVYSCVGK